MWSLCGVNEIKLVIYRLTKKSFLKVKWHNVMITISNLPIFSKNLKQWKELIEKSCKKTTIGANHWKVWTDGHSITHLFQCTEFLLQWLFWGPQMYWILSGRLNPSNKLTEKNNMDFRAGPENGYSIMCCSPRKRRTLPFVLAVTWSSQTCFHQFSNCF